MDDKAKIERCKYSHPHFKNNSIEYHCVVDGWEDDKVQICKKGECESCQNWKTINHLICKENEIPQEPWCMPKGTE